jgi:hypothetical protein
MQWNISPNHVIFSIMNKFKTFYMSSAVYALLVTVILCCVLPGQCSAREVQNSNAPIIAAGLTLCIPLLPGLLSGDTIYRDETRPIFFLSSLGSGLGYFYLRDYRKAAITTGLRLFVGEISYQFLMSAEEDQLLFDNDAYANLSQVTWFDMNYYATYAAYREGRILTNNKGYKTPLHKTSLTDYLKAPFKGKYMKRKSTWIPLGVFALFSGIGYLSVKENEPARAYYRKRPVWLFREYRTGAGGMVLSQVRNGILSMNAGLTEEALFRGVIQNELVRVTDHPKIALVGASALFGLAHWDFSNQNNDENRQRVYTTGLIGAYLGWLYMRNNYRLEQSIAMHFWWDIIAFTTQFLINPNDFYGTLSISLPCSFRF